MVELQHHVGTRRKVRLERNRPSNPLLNGYLLAKHDGLVLMHPFDDFEPNGYAIIRELDVVSLRSDEHERLWDRMLEGEGLLGGLDVPPTIDLSSMHAAIKSAASRSHFVSIQCEDKDEPNQDFYFAELVEATTDAIHVRHVNGLAQWEDDIAVVPTNEITMVEFDTPYLRRFAKYISQQRSVMQPPHARRPE